MPKLIEYQYKYKKQIGFTKIQHQSLIVLKKYGININQFIREAIKEKIQKDWKEIKEKKKSNFCPF